MKLKNYLIIFSLATTMVLGNPVYTLEHTHPQSFNKSSKESRCIKIALEGMPGAGKTTTLLRLVSELEGTCVVLSELLPEPNADWSILSIKDQATIYHKLWVSRMKIVQQLSPHTNCFFFDRTYFTSLAFSYATDNFFKNKQYLSQAQNKERYTHEPSYEGFYEEQKKLTAKDLEKENFDLIIFLDVLPNTGLDRRNHINDNIPWLSSEKMWLSLFRDFYHKEFPKFHKGKILYIDTEKLSLDETAQKIKDHLKNELNIISHPKKITSQEADLKIEKQLLDYGKNLNLGPYRSQMVYVYGYPTIYYRKHSIQLVDNQLKCLNNYQLNLIAKHFKTANQ
jgi:thymidylate kinase